METSRDQLLSMDNESMNQYEKQLYSMFKTFDVTNEEALDKVAVLQLCDALQLEERGTTLADTLFERRSGRVTFAQFRSGLLTVLGAGEASRAPHAAHSDEDSSGREVAPKFVFGSKKYGRRSRPQHASDEHPSPRAASDSRLDLDGRRGRERVRCKRSASSADGREEGAPGPPPPDLDHDKVVDRERALTLCRDLRLDIDRRLVERIFEEPPMEETTVGEFFDRLNASLTSSVEAARETVVASVTVDGYGEDALTGELVVEAWERAGLRRPRRLLAELGFTAATVRPADLERALDEELRALPDAGFGPEPPDARHLIPLAALVLARLRLERAERRAEVAIAERDKLRADLAEANERARLLAQDVDESHTRIEAELRASARRAEQRHAEATRAAAAELAAERERAAAARADANIERTRRAEAELKWRTETDALRYSLTELETRATNAEAKAAAAERDRLRAVAESRLESAESASVEEDKERSLGAEARVDALRRENETLRDRCDELVAALEVAGREQSRPAPSAANVSWQDEAATVRSHDCEKCDSGLTDGEVDESPGDELRETSRRDRELAECGMQTDENVDDRDLLADVVMELEHSLEQLKADYDRNEEYWSGKLDAERREWAEEARAGDQRLAELASRVLDYERQFAARTLPAIDERGGLEAQINHLQDEFAEYRKRKESELRARGEEVTRLQEKVAALERAGERRARCGCEAEELRSRAARAEGAVRRLHARLAHADLLVKDLYIENCQLARHSRRPL